MKKLTSLAFALLLVFVGVCPAQAEETPPVRYSHVYSVAAGLQISGTTASCFGAGRGKDTATTTHILVTLQGRPAGSSHWYTAVSWTASASGTGTATVNQTHSVATENSYRVRVRCQIKDSDGNVLETVTKYSSIWTI